MPPIRVLLVDDAVVVRRLLVETLAADPEIEVVGTAPNGRVALAKVEQLQPDLVLLDLEMPELDGFQTLRALRANVRGLPVLIFSSLSERGAIATVDALTLGASDYLLKPSGLSDTGGLTRVRADLVAKIKALAGGRRAAARRPVPVAAVPTRTLEATPRRVEVVGIAASTGGPNALAALLAALPADFPAPVLIVQHMPAAFTRLLATRLAQECRLPVAEGFEDAPVEPGRVWLAPGGRHLSVVREGTRTRLHLSDGPPEHSCRPAANLLFRSLARVYGAGTVAAVLSGMGQDGLEGARAIREAGGWVVVQDEATSVVWGMPGQVAEAGLADRVLPLGAIPTELHRRAQPDAVPVATVRSA